MSGFSVSLVLKLSFAISNGDYVRFHYLRHECPKMDLVVRAGCYARDFCHRAAKLGVVKALCSDRKHWT